MPKVKSVDGVGEPYEVNEQVARQLVDEGLVVIVMDDSGPLVEPTPGRITEVVTTKRRKRP